jgi:type III secretion HrpO family protein
MTSLGDLAGLGESALLVSLLVSLPVVGIAAIVGLVVAAFQAATQLQDATIAHLPRLVAVALALVVLGPWMGSTLAAFALEAFAAR